MESIVNYRNWIAKKILSSPNYWNKDYFYLMTQQLGQLSLLVREYDEAINYYTQTLGFELLEDTPLSETKRWVRVSPPGSTCHLLLAKAANETQIAQIGHQAGGRVFLFLYTDDFYRDYENYRSKEVEFIREPARESFGMVSVFKDMYGNLWDLIEQSHADFG